MLLRMLLVLVAVVGLSVSGCKKEEPKPVTPAVPDVSEVVEEAEKAAEEAAPAVEDAVKDAEKAAEHPEK